MAIPTKYRDRLLALCDGQLVLTIDVRDPCLLLYPLQEWEEIERKLSRLPALNEPTRRLQRLWIGHATECELDTHGRILLPPMLRNHATLEKRCVILGQGARFEIWNEEIWNERREQWLDVENDDNSELPEELRSLTF